jgi:nucleoside transporter
MGGCLMRSRLDYRGAARGGNDGGAASPGFDLALAWRDALPCAPSANKPAGEQRMNTSVRVRLSAMMFFQYFIWGSWFVTMGPYLGGTLNFSGAQIGVAYNSTALAAMISPFFVGMVADRFFSTERVLAVLHVLGGLLLLGAARATSFEVFYPLLIGHTLCYMPTLALTNSISFHQMTDPGKQFPGIRVLGTIGWIVAGFTVGALGSRAFTTPAPFYIGSAVSILMGIYCLTLPHTPPQTTGRVTYRDVLGLDALRLMRERSFAIFVACAFLLCIPLTFYFSFTPTFLTEMNVGEVPQTMAMGQVSEIFFMLVMPWFFVRLGVKYMLIVGMFCWGARYLLFVLGYNADLIWPLYLGVILHGICYDFFFVTAYIYVDKKAPVEIRAKAQGFIAFVTLGAGMFVGANLSGVVVDKYSFPRVEPAKVQIIHDADLWAVGNYVHWEIDGVSTYGRLVELERPNEDQEGRATVEVYERGPDQFEPSGQVVELPLSELTRPLRRWDRIWMMPALGSLLIMGLFGVLFQHREDHKPAAT